MNHRSESTQQAVVFVSYSHHDEQEKNELVAHLRVLRHGAIGLFADDQIPGGDDWERSIVENIEKSSIAVLLVTADFLTSDYILKTELPAVLRRKDSGDLMVYPILGKSCAWENVPWLRRMNVRPRNNRPVWSGSEPAVQKRLAAIANEIAKLAAGPGTGRDRRVPKAGSSGLYYRPEQHRRDFCALLDRFTDTVQSESMERVFGRDALLRWKHREASLREHIDAELSIAVVAPFKRGKSSLINALLREDLAATDVAPETVTINEIRYGETLSAEACFADGARMTLSPDGLTSDKLAVQLSGVPNELTHLEIRAPIEWLRGLSIVDTPGTGDLFRRFDRKVQEYLTRADVILFVLSALEPLSQSEREFLQLAVAPQDFARVVFAVNLLDRVHGERDAVSILGYLGAKIGQLFPGSLLFGVSALDELTRIKGEARPAPDRKMALGARFDGFRAHLEEAIVQNRELLQIDRGVQELKVLLDDVLRYAEKLKATIENESAGIESKLKSRQDEENRLNVLIDRDATHFREEIREMARQTNGWLSEFFDRLEDCGSRIAAFGSEDLQKHFPFFVADSLRIAIHRCLDAHRNAIFQKLRQGRTLPATAEMASAAGAGIGEGSRSNDRGLQQSASAATTGSDLWERLDTARLLSDLAQTTVFGIVTGLMEQLKSNGREQRKALLYQERFQREISELRNSVLRQAEEIYSQIGERLIQEMGRQEHEELAISFRVLEQSRRLGREEHWEEKTLNDLPGVCASIQDDLVKLERRLSPDSFYADSTGLPASS